MNSKNRKGKIIRNWKYVEKLGSDLRKLIADSKHKEILKMIYEISSKYADLTNDVEEYGNDFVELRMLVDGEWDYKDEELSEYNWESWTELVDDRLYSLYNACDKYDVFLSL